MNLSDQIRSIPDLELHQGKDLTSSTTMRLASVGDLIEVKSAAALRTLLPLLISHDKSYVVLGWGANQILPARCPFFLIHLDLPVETDLFLEARVEYRLPASVGLNQLTAHAMKFGLRGWEVFTGIPASLGGAVCMNAGTNLGEIGKLVRRVEIVTPGGELRTEDMGPGSFTYRHNHFLAQGEVIVSATLIHLGQDPAVPSQIKDYLDYRKRTQPLATRNCGCVFKNPARDLQAGRLIDSLGLKGLAIGGLRISPKHANFMENTGASEWHHFEDLLQVIQFHMDHFYGIEFELEVKIPYD